MKKKNKPPKEFNAVEQTYILENMAKIPVAKLAQDLDVATERVQEFVDKLLEQRKQERPKNALLYHPSGAVQMTEAQSEADDEFHRERTPQGASLRNRPGVFIPDPTKPVR